jgi:hypothetical protein
MRLVWVALLLAAPFVFQAPIPRYNVRRATGPDPQNTESWPHVPSRFGELIFVE